MSPDSRSDSLDERRRRIKIIKQTIKISRKTNPLLYIAAIFPWNVMVAYLKLVWAFCGSEVVWKYSLRSFQKAIENEESPEQSTRCFPRTDLTSAGGKIICRFSPWYHCFLHRNPICVHKTAAYLCMIQLIHQELNSDHWFFLTTTREICPFCFQDVNKERETKYLNYQLIFKGR